MHIVVRPLDNASRRRTGGATEHFLETTSFARKKRLVKSCGLWAGEKRGILMDQNVGLTEGVFVDFFGVKACAGTAFVKFAHHSGALLCRGLLYGRIRRGLRSTVLS